MNAVEDFFSGISEHDKEVFLSLLAFKEYFSIDWFSGNPNFLLSQLFTMVSALSQKKWVASISDDPGFYRWAKDFPRSAFLKAIPPEIMMPYYRNSVSMLQEHLPMNDQGILSIAHQCLSAGLEPSHINIIYRAAVTERKQHRISSAINLLHTLLSFIDNYLETTETKPPKEMLYTFLKALARVVTYSTIFDPNKEKIYRWLSKGLVIAAELEEKAHEAFLHLCMGLYYWTELEYKASTDHFDGGWAMIQTINDQVLYRKGFQLQGLSLWLKGQVHESIRIYEESLGKTEDFEADDLTYVTALHLAQSYAEIGMPQRGLGIAETILSKTEKQKHWPMASYALVTMGSILLEIMQLENSRTYFEKGLNLSVQERLPRQEVIASLGLAKIECLKGNYTAAADHFRILAKIHKSKWLHFFNLYPVFDVGYILYAQNVYTKELELFLNHVDRLRAEQLNPFLHGLIKLQHLKYLEPNLQVKDKLEEFKAIETSICQIGETIELAKLRTDIASMSLQVNDWEAAELYAQSAWKFLKPICKNLFPNNLRHFIHEEENTDENKLSELIIEIGEALSNQENLEQLLCSIITSISRMMGAERTALFIKDKFSSELQITASRNFTYEHMNERWFKAVSEKIKLTAESRDSCVIEKKISFNDSDDALHICITPLVLNKRVTGVLYLDSRFLPFDNITQKHKLLSALGTQIAVSVDRAQAYDEILQLNKNLIRENQYYQDEQKELRPFGNIIGISGAILQVQVLIQKVASTQSTVLIHGETGVGKELIARAIHNNSPRCDKPFIRVNCAALPDTLIDSELFGHEKGAFTGAIKTKAGRFELANNGTIFLDEISELPPSTQARLLRILQEKEFQRVGGTKTLSSDFRLIAATNKDLEREVAKGKFRADLFYRLNIFPIFVPPLRERKEDIPPLAIHFFHQHCSQFNKHFDGIPESEMDKLVNYNWPGNIRELSNIIERSVILGKDKISFSDIVNRKKVDNIHNEFMDSKEFEKAQILKALRLTNGTIGGPSGAASLLGLNRTTLASRIKRHNISVKKVVS